MRSIHRAVIAAYLVFPTFPVTARTNYPEKAIRLHYVAPAGTDIDPQNYAAKRIDAFARVNLMRVVSVVRPQPGNAVADFADHELGSITISGGAASDVKSLLSNDVPVLLILSIVGAIGGYLSAIQDSRNGSKRRFKEAKFRMMQGAAGAIIIVTLSPVDPNIVNGLFGAAPQAFIKLIALALIGGYAGGSLLESSASQYAKRIDKIEEKQKSLEEEAEKERNVISSVEQMLRGKKLSTSEIQAFQKELEEISSSKRWEIGYKADENRRQHWQKDKEPMERSFVNLSSVGNDR